MSDARRDCTRIGFAKTFLLPALLIFLVPVVSLAFFWHAQSLFNSRARESVLGQIRADATLSAEEERAIVVRAFPELTIEGKDGSLVLDHESIYSTAWSQAVHFGEITQVALDENGVLKVHYNCDGKQKEKVKMKTFGTRQQETIDPMNRYYSRYLNAVAYQTQKKQEASAANE